MLVLQRRAGESILIGDHVEVRVLRVGAKQVKLGVIAPREMEIRRSELEELNRQARIDDWRDAGLDDLAKRIRKPDE